ncbi:MAG: restriction endonuclease-like protein [Muribaculaceae bacterium]|nr:restriction endonuclease-like protein [Muribaculaceae bacterium]
MELLKIKHQDFDLFIECGKFNEIWGKAKRNVGEDSLTSTYTWSDGVEWVKRLPDDAKEIAINQGEAAPAIFFDNTDYPIWVEFREWVKHARFGSMLQADNERFSFHRRGRILSGFLNYGNEIGRSEINLIYEVEGRQRRFTFGYEVLSTKLNYHEHWKQIVADIEAEYRMLSLDYMKRTFHGFNPDTNGERPDLVWWSVFEGEQEKFVKAVRSIIDRPRHRMHSISTYQRADKLQRITTNIENELVEHRREPAHLYRVEEQIPSNDTQENRFLKYALGEISKKYNQLKERIESLKNTSEEMRKEMNKMQATLKHLQHNPFFRTVGRFKGLNQESLILQKASGYSQAYRTWNLLRRAYSLNDGIYRLQTKDIATLYEIWCFIEVSHIVKEQLHLGDEDVDHRNRMEMNGIFTWELGKGEHSRILFKKDNVELAELVYNPKHTDKVNDNISMENIYVATVAQKPDIVLQLTKDDMRKGMKMTYLFDAKYRIDGRDSRGVDTPPEDAINQMHRYRDAIYYKSHSSAELKKEIIGGYILFPGDGAPADVEVSKFYKTIDEVNIGAFPLRPKDKHNRYLLEQFIKELIEKPSAEIVTEMIPQKGAFVEVGNRVLVGVAKRSNRKGYLESFEDGTADLYYTGPKFPTTIALHNLHFFIPYIKGKGIRDVYEVVRVRTITAQEAKQDDSNGDDMRLAFELKFNRRLFAEYQKIDTSKMINYTFIDTTFDQISGY